MTEFRSVPDQFVIDEIARGTQDLRVAAEVGRFGAQGNREIRDRIHDTTERVLTSRDRLAVDIDKTPGRRTEYDVERAHLAALAVDKAMTYIARDEARRAARGKMDSPLSLKRQRAELARAQYERLAHELYASDPIGNGPNVLEHEKQRRSGRFWRRPEF